VKLTSAESGPAPGAKRAAAAAGVVVLVAAVAWTLWAIPSTRTVLRQSFTEMPAPYIELYFTSAPSVAGGLVTVPISVNDHGANAVLQIKVQLVNGSGHVTAQTTTSVSARSNIPVPLLVHLPARSGTDRMWVYLLDHPQTLHFRIGTV